MTRLLFIQLILLLIIPNTVFAEIDGQSLFKSKCNTCHMIDKNSTGPALQGVRAKWEDAGELNYLYEWVYNSRELLSTNKSSMAAAIKNYSATVMPAQQVNQEEIDAIFAYIDNWQPKETIVTTDVVVAKDYSSYESRLTMAYILGGMILFLIVAVVVISNVLVRLMRSGIQLKKRNASSPSRRIAVLATLSVLFIYWMAPNSVGEASGVTEPPWLLIETYQLYILLTVNILLVLVLFRLKSLFQMGHSNPS